MSHRLNILIIHLYKEKLELDECVLHMYMIQYYFHENSLILAVSGEYNMIISVTTALLGFNNKKGSQEIVLEVCCRF